MGGGHKYAGFELIKEKISYLEVYKTLIRSINLKLRKERNFKRKDRVDSKKRRGEKLTSSHFHMNNSAH